MHHMISKNMAALSLLLLASTWASTADAQVVRAFAPRYTNNINGDVRLIGNTLLENRLEEERQKSIEETINKLAGDEEEVKGTATRPGRTAAASDSSAMQEETMDHEMDRKELPKPRGLESFSGTRISPRPVQRG